MRGTKILDRRKMCIYRMTHEEQCSFSGFREDKAGRNRDKGLVTAPSGLPPLYLPAIAVLTERNNPLS